VTLGIQNVKYRTVGRLTNWELLRAWKDVLQAEYMYIHTHMSSFGGLVVSMLAAGTQDHGFAPGQSRRIFRAIKSSACLPSEGK
jgi:hypothetical protein